MAIKTIKLNPEQSAQLASLLAAQSSHRAAASKARTLESEFKSLRAVLLPLVGQSDFAILVSTDGKKVKFECKVSKLKARAASESVRWDIAEVG